MQRRGLRLLLFGHDKLRGGKDIVLPKRHETELSEAILSKQI